MAPKSDCIADIGCDHALVGIALLTNGTAKKIIASDLRKGPLENAKKNAGEILPSHLFKQIEFRLGGGFDPIQGGEAQAAIIAGMGGELMQKILIKGNPHALGINALILEPQSDHCLVRRYLRNNNYKIIREKMIREENKFYPIIYAEYSASDNIRNYSYIDDKNNSDEIISAYDRFGPYLINSRDDMLYTYLTKENASVKKIIKNVDKNKHINKFNELTEILNDMECALSFYE